VARSTIDTWQFIYMKTTSMFTFVEVKDRNMVFCGAFVAMSLKLVWALPRLLIATTSPNFEE